MRGIRSFLFLFLLLSVFGCKKEETEDKGTTPLLPGGKGGTFSVAVFSTNNGSGIPARVYMKFGADQKPTDTLQYDEKYNTMVEPGFGPHAHFENLQKGTYFIFLKSGSLSGDTVLQITDASPQSQDIAVELN